MITYKLQNKDGITVSILKSDGWSIPLDINNTDYQAYLKWLDEGGIVLPADEPNS